MAKTLKNEDLKLNIIVNGDSAKKAFREAADEANLLKDKLELAQKRLKDCEKTTGKGSRAYEEYAYRVKLCNKEYSDAVYKVAQFDKQLKLETMSLNDLQRHLNFTRKAFREAEPNSKQWRELQAELIKTKTRIQEVNSGVSSMGRAFKSFYENLSSIFVLYRGIMKLVSATDAARQAFLDYDEALTDARKTTGLSVEDANDLADSLKKIDTRTSTNELLGLVRAGGKLGISGKEDLLGFARAADQINIALSKDLGGNAEAAITSIGKMTDIFNLKEIYGIEDSMLKVGSAINSLGMASTANEGYLVDFAARFAGIAPNADISIDKVLGLAASLDQFSQQSETSATALSQTIVAMYKRTETFANIAKMSFADFKKLLDTDVNEALLRVLAGMKGNEGGMAEIVNAMSGMHLNGQRAVTVLGALADKIDIVRAQQELAAKAFSEGTSIIDEANLKNETAEARQEKLQKALEDTRVEIGSNLQPAYLSFLEASNSLLSVLSTLIGLFFRYQTAIIATSVAIATIVRWNKIADTSTRVWAAAKKLLSFWSKTNRADLVLETEILIQQAAVNKNVRAGTLLLAAAKNFLTGKVKAATTAMKAFFGVVKANPLGLVITGISLLVGVISSLSSKAREAREEEQRLKEEQAKLTASAVEAKSRLDSEKSAMDKLKEAAFSAAEGSDERRKAINAINDKYNTYLPNLLTEKSSNEDIAIALSKVNTELARNIYLNAKKADLEEVGNKALSSLKETNQDIQELFKDTPENAAAAMSAITDLYNAILDGKDASAAESTLLDVIEQALGPEKLKRAEQEFRWWQEARAAAGTRTADLVGEDGKSYGRKLAESRANEYFTSLLATYKDKITEFKSEIMGYASQEKFLEDFYDALLGGDTVPPDKVLNPGGGGEDNPNGDPDKDKWSLSKDKKFQEDKLSLTKQYLDGEIQTEKEYNSEILRLEIEALERRLAAVKEGSEERMSLEQDILERRIRRKKAEDAAQAEADKAAISGMESRIASEKANYDLERQELENFWDARISLEAQGSEKEKQLKEKKNQALLAIDLKYLKSLKEYLKQIIDAGVLDGVEIPADKLLQLKQQLADTVAKILGVESKQKPEAEDSGGGLLAGTGDGELFGVSQAQWDALLSNIEAGKLGAQDLNAILAGIGGAAQEGFKLASMAIQMTNAKEQKALKEYQKANDKKKADLKDRYEAGLITQTQYDAEVAALEEEMEARQEEMEIRQAERQKKMNIAEAIINNALAVTKTWAQWGWPAGIIPAAIQTALGAAQVAFIASTPVSGREKGGRLGKASVTRAQDGRTYQADVNPEQRGFVAGPTVIVGENGTEYVLPAEAVANPTIAPFINTIESARRAGRLRSLNLAAVAPLSLYGRASGGTISPGTSEDSAPAATTVVTVMDEGLRASMDRFSAALSKPIVAEVAITGRKGFAQKLKEYNRMKENGSL